MEVTGKSFEMNPKTFTLANLFAMELHTVANVIEEITTYVMFSMLFTDSGTVALERSRQSRMVLRVLLTHGVQCAMSCSVTPRSSLPVFSNADRAQGTEDRGYVLKSTDDIMALIDDNSLNLQSMQASPYVKAFLDMVCFPL